MRTILTTLLVLTGGLLAAVVYERLFVEKTFGPSAMLAIAAVAAVFLAILLTLMLQKTRYRDLTGKVWLAVFSATLSFLAFDLIAGYFLIQPLSPVLVPDPYRHHKLVPNSYSRIEQRDFSYIQRVNGLGMRGRDISAIKPRTTFRIAMLGDSFTMGKGVEDEETFSTLLETALNSKVAGCQVRAIEVLNAGVDSYAPVLSMIHLKREVAALSPDLVVLNLDVSDLVQESMYRRQAVYGPDGEVIAVPVLRERTPSMTERVRTWTDRHLFFTRAFLYYVTKFFGYRDLNLQNVLTRADAEIAAHTLEQDTEDRAKQWEAIFDSISRLQAFSRSQRSDFLLSMYPWPHEVSDTEWIPGRYTFIPRGAVTSDRRQRTIRAYAERHDVPLLDLFPAFRDRRPEPRLFYQHDMHWTPAGHQVVADVFRDHLERRYLSQWCPAAERGSN